MHSHATNETRYPDDAGSALEPFMDREDITITRKTFPQDTCLKMRIKGSMY